MKIVISDPKSGRSASMEITADKAAALAGRKVGDEMEGSFLEMQGYKLKITGGSDKSGFPMDRSIQGTGKIKVLKLIAVSGKEKGQYRRKTVRGGIISDAAQVNMSITAYGEKKVEEIFGPQKAKAAAPEKK